MYENIPILIFIFCVVTLMYCKKEIMKYKNPSIVQQEYKKIIWEEMIMDKYDDIISRQLQMFELSKRIEAKSEGQWTQFQRDTVPFILWKISESKEGMSYIEVLSCLEQFDSLRPLLPRYEVDVLLSLIELSECGVLEQSEDCDNYEDGNCRFRWNKEGTKT